MSSVDIVCCKMAVVSLLMMVLFSLKKDGVPFLSLVKYKKDLLKLQCSWGHPVHYFDPDNVKVTFEWYSIRLLYIIKWPLNGIV
jgi:hypothetical protein